MSRGIHTDEVAVGILVLCASERGKRRGFVQITYLITIPVSSCFRFLVFLVPSGCGGVHRRMESWRGF